MTPVPAATPPAAAAAVRPDYRTGLLISALVLVVFGGVAVSVDVPRASFGFKSDEATYYMMAHSLAKDGDLTYRREDLERVWKEYPSGPSGIFLKKGRVMRVRGSSSFPFVRVIVRPDPDQQRLYYGKSYIYPLLASPFVFIAGTNGFLIFHAWLLALAVGAAYLFVNARSPATVAALIATAYLLASVAAGYFVWITPELFNLVLVMLGLFCWSYKLVAPPDLPPALRWLRGGWSDVAACVLIACASFSKPPNALFIAPVLATWLAERRWGRTIALGALFGLLVCGFFAVNAAITGDINFQGGERNTYYGTFPFMSDSAGFDVGLVRATDRVLTDIVFDRHVFWSRLGHNIVYFWLGRHSGAVPYFFPGVFALACFLWPRSRRLWWQWLVLGIAAVEIVVLLVWIPYNYFGGAGVLGNRYYMNFYGAFLFVVPPLRSRLLAAVPWVGGAIFTSVILLNPFYYSFRPYEHMQHGPLRLLPVELTLVNDLPINTNPARVRVWFGDNPDLGDPGFQIYFLDENAYQREADKSFWVKGESRADFLIKTDRPVRRAVLRLEAGAVPTDVRVSIGGRSQDVHLEPGRQQQISIALGDGFPYQGRSVWMATVSSSGGFSPLFHGNPEDSRYLGVRVRPVLVP